MPNISFLSSKSFQKELAKLVIFCHFCEAFRSGHRGNWGTCSHVPSGFSWRRRSWKVQLPAETDAQRVQRRYSDNAGWVPQQTSIQQDTADTFLISHIKVCFLLVRSWFPNKEDASGRGKDKPADMGHSWTGEVLTLTGSKKFLFTSEWT